AASVGAAGPPVVEIRTEDDLRGLLDRLDARVEAVHTARQLEFYLRLVGRPAPNVGKYQQLHREIFADRVVAAALEAWRDRAADPVTSRRVALYLDRYLNFLYDTFRTARVEPSVVERFTALQDEIDAAMVAFRPAVGGERVTRARVAIVLRTDPDRSRRREAFLSRAEASATLAAGVRGLLRVSNEMHRQMGYRDTVEGRLDQSGLSPDEVAAWLGAIEEATRGPYREMLDVARLEMGVERVEAWDVDFRLERAGAATAAAFPKAEAVPRLLASARALGFDPDALPITIEDANLANAGWNIPVRIPSDVRLVLNPTDGFQFHATLFHEYGHALHEASIDQSIGTFRSDRPGQFGEGMAGILERLPGDPEWQRRMAGLTGESIARAAQTERLRRIWRLRGIIARSRLHHAAFADPDGDLDAAEAESWKTVLMLEPPERPLWADDMFLAQPQVYMQNYVIGEMIAAQAWETLRERFGDGACADPRVGPFLREAFYRHGQAVEWRDLIERATGRPLDPAALLRALGVP
ncbi:MAG: hypothetical protein QME96_13720, partial [Myxococcota bacterium]|nr:hypothetical protein [Myxococcota bacterium]